MDAHRVWRGLTLVALVPLLAGLTACGGDDKKATTAEPNACGTLPTADPTAKLPAGFPARDQVLYEPSVQGKTTIVFGLVDESSFIEVRDDYVDKLMSDRTGVGAPVRLQPGCGQAVRSQDLWFSCQGPPPTASRTGVPRGQDA